jgi:mRNA interferase MazF
VTSEFVPDRGDIVWLAFDPQAGREQAGRRPALVLSPLRFNRLTGMALVCPITSRRRGWAFEVEVPAGLPITGVILADQARALDWRARRAELEVEVDAATLASVLARVRTLID